MIRMRRRGTALILAIFFLGFCQVLAMGFTRLIPSELNGSLRFRNDVASSLAADAGIQYALAYLEQKLAAGEEPVPGPETSLILRSAPLGLNVNGWEWEVTVLPDEQTPPRGNNPRRAYALESRALFHGEIQRKVTTQVVQESFVRYARFTNEWSDPSVAYWAGAQFFEGPVHSNDIIRIGIHPGYYTNGFPQLFQNRVTSAGGIEWSPATLEAPPSDAAQLRRVFNVPRLPATTGRIEVPWDTTMVRDAALGAGSPTGPITANRGAGIFVQGDVDEIVLDVENGDPVQRITVGGTTYKVQEMANRTTVTNLANGNRIADYQGAPNGTIYATGNILQVRGVNKGRHTIAVNSGAGKKIGIGGDILQVGTSKSTPASQLDNRNCLGLLAHTVQVPHSLDPGSLPQTGLTVHAAIMAGDGKRTGGGLATERLDDFARDDTHHNYLNIVGSIIEDRRNITAHINPGSGWTTRSEFDKSLKDAPPPYFPSEPTFTVRGYSDEFAH